MAGKAGVRPPVPHSCSFCVLYEFSRWGRDDKRDRGGRGMMMMMMIMITSQLLLHDIIYS